MRVAACDPDAFYPLRNLVVGPFRDLSDLAAIERFVRTVVLHDEIVMEIPPIPYHGESELLEEEIRANGGVVITGFGPAVTRYGFFADYTGPESAIPEIELSESLLNAASQYSNAGEGNVYFDSAVKYLKRLLAIVEDGGSVLVCGDFGHEVISVAERYPEELFRQLDADWRRFAQEIDQDGLDLLVPPVLGIVLTRCARRDAIPAVIRDLRDEWSVARRKVWEQLDALRSARTLREALDIRRELSEASRLFSPSPAEIGTRPIRALWDRLAAAVGGATTALLSGGHPAAGAATNLVGQVARSFPGLTHELGPTILGRGALDLARRVRRATAEVEFDALKRLLLDSESQKLGLK
jgi:hypothetical protein